MVTLGTKPHATLLDLTDENEDEESCSIDNFGKQWVLRDGNVELIIFASLMRWLASGACSMKANHRRREITASSTSGECVVLTQKAGTDNIKIRSIYPDDRNLSSDNGTLIDQVQSLDREIHTMRWFQRT